MSDTRNANELSSLKDEEKSYAYKKTNQQKQQSIYEKAQPVLSRMT